jgi:hypothetical protein
MASNHSKTLMCHVIRTSLAESGQAEVWISLPKSLNLKRLVQALTRHEACIGSKRKSSTLEMCAPTNGVRSLLYKGEQNG